MSSYRKTLINLDKSGFASPSTNEIGAMVLKSMKGQNKPVLCQTQDEVLTHTGNPSATYNSVFEALAYVKKAPLWIVCPYGNNSLFGGVDITASTISPFAVGREDPANFSFTGTNALGTFSIGTGDGVTANYTGTITDIPIDSSTVQILVDGVAIDVIDDGDGTLSGTGLDGGGANTVNYTTGAYDITLSSGVVTSADTKAITFSFRYDDDVSATISHSIFATSPYSDNLVIDGKWVVGNQFEINLYEKSGSTNVFIETYYYSLDREKDNFKKSIYFEDVFDDNPYVTVIKNSAFTGTYTVNVTTPVAFAGGVRNEAEGSNILTAWNYFQKKRKYPVKNFVDALGGDAVNINNLITNYQPYAHGITCISIGQSVSDAITERDSYSVNSDAISIYHNWVKIKDPYNDSYAWICQTGSIGGKYALMEDIYDSGSPAGIDEDKHGGLLSDWTYIETETDYSDLELQQIDEAQINPIIFDDTYGMMAYGDKTAQVSLSDTSYVGHKRAYNYLIDKIFSQVLTKQIFKNNDQRHRDMVKVQIEDLISSTLGAVGAFREWAVIVNEKNNNDTILDQRKFLVDVLVKVTPNSQFVTLRLTRLAQGASVAEFI